VLDVGGGAGVVAAAVLAAYPRAKVTLQDYSEPMIEFARKTLAGRAGQVRYVLCDLRDAAWEAAVGGPGSLRPHFVVVAVVTQVRELLNSTRRRVDQHQLAR